MIDRFQTASIRRKGGHNFDSIFDSLNLGPYGTEILITLRLDFGHIASLLALLVFSQISVLSLKCRSFCMHVNNDNIVKAYS